MSCSIIIPTGCSPYTGKDFTFMKDEDKLTCNATANSAFELIDKYLAPLVEGNDFSSLDTDCLTLIPGDPVTALSLHEAEISAICVLKGQVETLTTSLANLKVGEELVTINLGALSPDAALCQVATNQYTLNSLLTIIFAKLNDFETRISILES